MKLSKKTKSILTAVLVAFLGGLGIEVADITGEPQNAPETHETAPAVIAEPEAEAAPLPKVESDVWNELDFSFGGFKKPNAQQAAEISTLKVSSGGLSYKWTSGGCEKLGAASKEDYSKTLACFFCRIGGKWIGGKFDWISTSRTTRSFENIRGGYNGWKTDAIEKADAFAFCIVSADGKKRTNVITTIDETTAKAGGGNW